MRARTLYLAVKKTYKQDVIIANKNMPHLEKIRFKWVGKPLAKHSQIQIDFKPL